MIRHRSCHHYGWAKTALFAGSPAALLAVKAGTTASVILLCERLRKDHHPVATVILMIGVNSAYAMVAAHNYRVLQRRH